MKRVLIIGAGFLQQFVIRKARDLNYYVIAIDGNPNAIGFKYAHEYECIDIVDQEKCLSFASEKNIDGVLTAATDFGVLTAAYIAKELELPGIDYDVAKIIKNKYLVKKILFEKKVDDTDQIYEIGSLSDLDKIEKNIKFPLMVKPCDGSGSRGASRVDDFNELVEACNKAMNASLIKKAVIETFINGKEYGAERLVVNGEITVLAIMQKWMTKPPYYAELGHAIPNDLNSNIEKKARNCVVNAIKELGINQGSVNMDLLITDDGNVYIVDIGARMGGNMIGPCIIPYGTGIDYMAAMIQASVNDDYSLKIDSDKFAVVTRLLAFKSGIVKKVPDIEYLENRYGVEIYHHLKKGMIVNEYHTNIDGCGYVVARDESRKIAEEKVDEVVKYIESYIF